MNNLNISLNFMRPIVYFLLFFVVGRILSNYITNIQDCLIGMLLGVTIVLVVIGVEKISK